MRRWDILGVLIYVALRGASTGYLAVKGDENWTFALISLGVFGVVLGGLAWQLTRGAEAPPIEVKRPALESGAVLIYLALYATIFLVYGMNWARHVVPPGREQ